MANPPSSQALNGHDVGELRAYIDRARGDPTVAERNPVVKATWVGGSRARVEDETGALLHTGGEGEPSAMRVLLGMLAACDVEVVSTHAALLGLRLERLEVEARGHFHVGAFLGLPGAEPPGYDRIAYTVRVRAVGASPEQLARLREACERASPVGDTLQRPVPLTLEFEPAP